jgi:hypothetical protein
MHILRHDLVRHIDHQLRDIGTALETPEVLIAAAVILAFLAIAIVMHQSSNRGIHAASIDTFPRYAHIEGFDP